VTLLERLGEVTAAPIILLGADAPALADAVDRWEAAGVTARAARGWKMRTVAALFDEVAAALQFPPYFGENWSAFDECLADLALPPRRRTHGLVLAVLDAEQVLQDENVAEFSALMHTVLGAHADFSEAVSIGEAWDRPPVPFHMVFGCHADLVEDLRTRLTALVAAEYVEVASLDPV
jgi:hypothetical protein